MGNGKGKMKNASRRLRSPFFIFHFLFFILLFTACSDKESDLGLNMVDPSTLYNGKTATFNADNAYSLRDDSLRTSGYSFCIIGNRNDALFGKASSELYTRIGLASGTTSINFDEVSIDSVVLTMVIDELYPDTTADYNFHFEVMQLAEKVDTIIYYATDALPVDPTKVFFNQTVTVGAYDSIITLKLDPSIAQVLNQSGSEEDFAEATKGLRIRIVDDDADEGMVTLNLAALQTCLTAHYHYGTDTTQMYYKFLVGTGVQHFTHFEHDYTGTIFAGVDSIDGASLLYLEPLGGYNVKLNFDAQLQAFREAHPLAVIHHAELVMPVAATSNTAPKPDQIIVSRCTDSNETYIPDFYDAYTYNGYDGTYDEAKGVYRVRITEHLQHLIREGRDPGMLLTLNSRRSSARQVALAGRSATDPIKIEIVYTE